MEQHMLWVLLIMIFCGLLGGFASYLMNKGDRKFRWEHAGSYSLAGIVASLIVPLFLNMISSDLLETSASNPEQLFVLGGFCLIAAVFSRQFLENIYSKVMQTVGDIQEEIERVSTEPDLLPEDASEETLKKHRLTEAEFNILRVMLEGKHLYRSLPGLSKGAELSKSEVNEALGSLMAKDLVEQKTNKEGKLRWYLSPNGRRLIGQLALEQQSEEAG